MYDLLNEIMKTFDPFSKDNGNWTTQTSSQTSSTRIAPVAYNPYTSDLICVPSNMDAKIYIHNNTGLPGIKDVIFNPPATIVLWEDGTKTVVKCQHSDVYSKETGLALAICKKAYGNKGSYNDIFNKWVK